MLVVAIFDHMQQALQEGRICGVVRVALSFEGLNNKRPTLGGVGCGKITQKQISKRLRYS